jgi:predicted alpha/beta superfamily hydrolase
MVTECINGNDIVYWTPKAYSVKSFLTEKSVYNGKKYLVYVILPPDYGKSDAPYPVLYALDGEEFYWKFGPILEETRKRVILVAIGNMGDLNRDEDNGMPGIKNFTKFVTQELAPIIEDSYNIDPHRRAILGQSWTGVGVSFMAFLEPTENRYFQTYISADGAYISSVNDAIHSLAYSLNQKTDSLPVTLILRSAQNGMYQLGTAFYNQISQYKFKDYHVSFSVISWAYHGWSIVEPVFRSYLENYEDIEE